MTPYEVIERFIEAHDLPIVPQNFYILAMDYSIDPSFALATWILETGYGKSIAWIEHYNPAGIKCGENYCIYDNADEGMASMFNMLNQYTNGSIGWIGEKRTLQEVRKRWKTVGQDDSELIYQIMLEIAEGGIYHDTKSRIRFCLQDI